MCTNIEIKMVAAQEITNPKVAVVFGASGVSGWSFVNEMLKDYPKKGIWGDVYAMTNRPLSTEAAYWPKDSRLNIVSGVDLLKGSQEDLEAELQNKVPRIAEVTHVYYLGKMRKLLAIFVNSLKHTRRVP